MVCQFDAEPLRKGVASKPKQQMPQRNSRAKISPSDLLAELIDGGFFKQPKELSAIKIALEEQGHFYPVTTSRLASCPLRELGGLKTKSDGCM